jgi:predicted DNA-binding transcriptional regulator AlpA
VPTDTLPPEAFLIPDATAAALAGVSRSHWGRLHAAARTPGAVKLGRRVLWNRSEVTDWIAARCSDRRTREALVAQSRRYSRVAT